MGLRVDLLTNGSTTVACKNKMSESVKVFVDSVFFLSFLLFGTTFNFNRNCCACVLKVVAIHYFLKLEFDTDIKNVIQKGLVMQLCSS